MDAAYMAAAAAFTPNLGWPLTVFATPEGRPFYAGHVLPARAARRHAVVPAGARRRAARRGRERREQVDGTADAVAAALAEAAAAAADDGRRCPTVDDLAARRATRSPRARTASSAASAAATRPRRSSRSRPRCGSCSRRPSASANARGVRRRRPRARGDGRARALRDPVEGGFFRYATRRDWTVPHYERMLTDNAQLLDVAHRCRRRADRPRASPRFLLDVLQQPGGGFGAAQDSESWIDGARSEGGYYARDAAARADLEPPGRRRQGRHRAGTGSRSARSRAPARASTSPRGSRRRAGPPTRCSAPNVATGRRARARIARRDPLDALRRRSPTTASSRPVSSRSRSATGEVAYAERARDLVARVRRRRTARSRAPGGGDPVLAAQGIGAPDAASDGDEPSGLAALAEAAVGAVAARRGRRAPRRSPSGSSPRTRPPRSRSRSRTARCCASPPSSRSRRGSSWSSADDPAAPLVRGRARASRRDVLAIVTPAQAAAWAARGLRAVRGQDAARTARPTAYDCRDFACRLPVTDAAGARRLTRQIQPVHPAVRVPEVVGHRHRR